MTQCGLPHESAPCLTIQLLRSPSPSAGAAEGVGASLGGGDEPVPASGGVAAAAAAAADDGVVLDAAAAAPRHTCQLTSATATPTRGHCGSRAAMRSSLASRRGVAS